MDVKKGKRVLTHFPFDYFVRIIFFETIPLFVGIEMK